MLECCSVFSGLRWFPASRSTNSGTCLPSVSTCCAGLGWFSAMQCRQSPSGSVLVNWQFVSGSGFSASRPPLCRRGRRVRSATAASCRLICLSLSRLCTSSGGMGIPLHDRCACIRAACVGRPGPFRVFSCFRHFARRFWNQICLNHHRDNRH